MLVAQRALPFVCPPGFSGGSKDDGCLFGSSCWTAEGRFWQADFPAAQRGGSWPESQPSKLDVCLLLLSSVSVSFSPHHITDCIPCLLSEFLCEFPVTEYQQMSKMCVKCQKWLVLQNWSYSTWPTGAYYYWLLQINLQLQNVFKIWDIIKLRATSLSHLFFSKVTPLHGWIWIHLSIKYNNCTGIFLLVTFPQKYSTVY